MSVVSNVKVYDLNECLIASGFPMRTKADSTKEPTEKDIKRCENLVKATLNGDTAHGQFMTGIRVNFDLTFTNKAWVEAERYRFLEFVSSQSTMHRIAKFDLDDQYIDYVDNRIINIMKEKVQAYNELVSEIETLDSEQERAIANAELQKKYLEILYSNPAGFKITARMTTNYRCLRNIYKQRKNHRLPEWREFCSWIETLPYAKEFLIN